MLRNKYLFFLLFSLLIACKKEKEQALPTVEELVAENIKAFRAARVKECHKGAIIEANRLVDSTLLANAKNKKAFATTKPPIPDKPIKPDPLKPIDSAAVTPILDLTEAAQDSINQLDLDLDEMPITKPDSLEDKVIKKEDF